MKLVSQKQNNFHFKYDLSLIIQMLGDGLEEILLRCEIKIVFLDLSIYKKWDSNKIQI